MHVPTIVPQAKEQVQKLLADAKVQRALAICQEEADFAIQEQIAISEVESPTFAEGVRAQFIADRMKAYGLTNVVIDPIGNVVGRRPGQGDGPTVVIAAHLDTVFPAGTDIKVKVEGNRLSGPGIGDNASGLRNILQVLRALEKANVQTRGDILFVGTVGEEGNGDIRGAKDLFKGDRQIDGFLAVDMENVYSVQNAATGAHRWRLRFEGLGGHSWLDYGRCPSAIHALCRAGAKIADYAPPTDPKTTFTIGTIKGGTTVNTIAAVCEVDVDMRSVDVAELDRLEAFILKAFDEAVEEENARWPEADEAHQLRLIKTQIGNRPAGQRPDDCPMVQSVLAGMEALNLPVKRIGPSSTDVNMAMSVNVPAACIGTGGQTFNEHSLREYFITDDHYLGPQLSLLSLLGMVDIV